MTAVAELSTSSAYLRPAAADHPPTIVPTDVAPLSATADLYALSLSSDSV